MQNQDLLAIWGWITTAFWKSIDGIKWCLEKLEAENATCDGLLLFLILFLITLLLGSAFWSVSIARCRRHKATKHFFLGLILPYGYPIYQLLHLQIYVPPRQETKGIEDENGQSEIIDNIKEEEIEQERREEEENRSEFNQEYFEKIARRPDGSPAGPWDAVFKGNIIHITKILEPLPDVVSVEFEVEHTIRKMRMRYELIQSLVDLTPEQPAEAAPEKAPETSENNQPELQIHLSK